MRKGWILRVGVPAAVLGVVLAFAYATPRLLSSNLDVANADYTSGVQSGGVGLPGAGHAFQLAAGSDMRFAVLAVGLLLVLALATAVALSRRN